ncbi:MAG: hypothetical protein AABP62_09490 [Planctomycetota bacterium]
MPNLRSSHQTELTATFPSHVVKAWLGNSERTAEKHCLQVLDSHFDRAVEDGLSPKAARYTSGSLGNASYTSATENDAPLNCRESLQNKGQAIQGTGR